MSRTSALNAAGVSFPKLKLWLLMILRSWLRWVFTILNVWRSLFFSNLVTTNCWTRVLVWFRITIYRQIQNRKYCRLHQLILFYFARFDQLLSEKESITSNISNCSEMERWHSKLPSLFWYKWEEKDIQIEMQFLHSKWRPTTVEKRWNVL